jgi:hypothetical protein
MPKCFVLAALLFATVPTTVLAQECPSRPFTLKVNIQAPKETLDRSKDSRSLSAMLSDSSLPGYVTQGLTRVDYSAGYSSEYLSRQRRDGTWCSTVNAVTVDFGFRTPPQIYVASELTEGSCIYREVMKHEYQHLRIAKDTLEAGRKWITKALKEELSKDGAISNTSDAANAMIERRINGIVNKITAGLYQTARFKNLALDTPENYARLGKLCR